ncbi:MAG: TolB family protein, partial [Anaerolineae bacterium]
ALVGEGGITGNAIGDSDISHNLFFYDSDAFVPEGENAIVADPMFVDADGRDFHLLPDSPALGAGVDVGMGESQPNLGVLGVVGSGDEMTVVSPPSIALEIRADGALRLTDPPGNASDQNAAFSPDGTQIVFTRFENGYNIGPAGLFRLDLAAGDITRLTPPEDQDNVNLPGSAWNAAANRIVFASDRLEADDLWQIAPDGSDFRRITAHEGAPWYIEPSWSPDGAWIVFEADADRPDDRQQGSIWKVRADGTGLTILTDGPAEGVDDRQPNWSPAGDRILFQRRDPGSEDWDIYTMAPDGSDVRLVTNQSSSDTDASWLPDGRFIVYSSDYGDLLTPNIYIIPAAGGEPVRVTFSSTNEDGAPSWSGDGRWIAFESHPGEDEDTPSALWRIAAPGNG